MIIRSKQQMYQLMERGALGNSFRIWHNVEDLIQSGFDGPLGIRCAGVPGLPYFHRLTIEQVIRKVEELKCFRCPIKIYEASQDEYITIQGEICEIDGLLVAELSRAKTHQRAALVAERITYYGLQVWDVLSRVGLLTEVDLNDLHMLLDTYPNHVIEFTAYEILVGQLLGRSHVVWEIRFY